MTDHAKQLGDAFLCGVLMGGPLWFVLGMMFARVLRHRYVRRKEAPE
jgi:hypothetical protein